MNQQDTISQPTSMIDTSVELPKSSEQLEGMYTLGAFTDADGNMAFRWEEANRTSELKTDISEAADRLCLDTYLAERAVGHRDDGSQKLIVDAFRRSIEQFVGKQLSVGDRVTTAFSLFDVEQNGISHTDQMRLGAMRAVAREGGFEVGPFVLDSKTRQISFSAVRPS